MANLSEAYDLSLFESRVEASVPAREPGQQEQPKRKRQQNIIELPEKELQRNARPKRHPIRMLAMGTLFSVIVASVMLLVNSNVKLTELTEEINATTNALTEEESVQIQLEMQASQEMNGAQVEEYAKTALGMSKISRDQVTYVNVLQRDQGTVVKELPSGSALDRFFSWVQSWFA